MSWIITLADGKGGTQMLGRAVSVGSDSKLIQVFVSRNSNLSHPVTAKYKDRFRCDLI